MRAAPWVIWATMIIATIVYLLHASPAHAAADCDFVAAFARRMAFFRDIGADPNKVTSEIRKEITGAGGATVDQLVRISQRVMRSSAPRDRIMVQEFERCRRSLGDLGRDS